MGKIRSVIQYLSKKFMDIYKPNKEMCVDEVMIKLQGCSTMKQYMPLKPVKRDIKVWVLADRNSGNSQVREIA